MELLDVQDDGIRFQVGIVLDQAPGVFVEKPAAEQPRQFVAFRRRNQLLPLFRFLTRFRAVQQQEQEKRGERGGDGYEGSQKESVILKGDSNQPTRTVFFPCSAAKTDAGRRTASSSMRHSRENTFLIIFAAEGVPFIIVTCYNPISSSFSFGLNIS